MVAAASLIACRRHAAVAVRRDSAAARQRVLRRGPLRRRARRLPRALRHRGPADPRAARAGIVQSALRVAEFGIARDRSRRARQLGPDATRGLALYADALWASGLFEEAETRYRDALTLEPDLARGHHGMARSLAARSQLDEAMDEAQAALRLLAARPRDSPHGRRQSTSGCTGTRRRPAPSATTSTCCRTRTTARRPTGRGPRSSSCARSASGCPFEMDPGADEQLYTDRLPPGERQGRRPREGQRRLVPGLRGRHRRREHDHLAADGAAARRHADHLHAQRRRRRRGAARAAAGAHQLARARSAEAAQRAVPHQGSAAPGPAGEGSRKPVAARARLLDDHRLQDAQDHLRQAPAGRSRPTSSCRCACTGWRPCAARWTARIRRISSSTPAAR